MRAFTMRQTPLKAILKKYSNMRKRVLTTEMFLYHLCLILLDSVRGCESSSKRVRDATCYRLMFHFCVIKYVLLIYLFF